MNRWLRTVVHGLLRWPCPRRRGLDRRSRRRRPPPAGRRLRRSSTASCSSATRRSPAPSSRRTASTSRSSSPGTTPATSGSRRRASPSRRRACVTTETKRPIPGFFWSRDSKLDPLRQGQGRRRELQRLGRRPGGAERGGQGRAGLAQPDRRQGRARVHLRGAEEVARHDLRRPQRPRRRLARRLQGHDLDRQARAACARTPSASRAGTSTSTASCGWPTRVADNGDTEILKVEPDGFKQVYTCTRVRDLRHRALPQGRQARLHADEQGRRRPHAARALRPRDRQGGARRVRPDEARRLRRRDLLRGDRRARRDHRTRTSARASTSATRRGRRTTSCCRRSSPGKEIGLGSSTADDRAGADHRERATPTPASATSSTAGPRSSRCSTRCASGSRASTWRR